MQNYMHVLTACVSVLRVQIYTYCIRTTVKRLSYSITGTNESARYNSFIPRKGCQFDLRHLPRRIVISRYIPCSAFGIVLELHA